MGWVTGLKRPGGYSGLAAKLRSAAVVTILALVGIVSLTSPTWGQIDWFLAHRFADVRTISTVQLAQALLQSGRNTQATKLVLLDIRSAEEFAVSHLPGARNVPPDAVIDFAERELAGLERSQPIVVYCSVGVRSAAAARDLQFLGFSQVKNLQGSLFQWANEGRAVVAGVHGSPEGQASSAVAVHPYNGFWGRLLRVPERP